MTEPNSQPDKPKDERRYDPELLKKGLRCDLDQYEMLMRCSDKKDITEWNEWGQKNPDQGVFLEGANIARTRRTSPEQEVSSMAHLRGANLSKAYLNYADLRGSDLQDANLWGAQLEGADLEISHLERVCFVEAHIKEAKLLAAHLNGADLMFADLEGAILNGAYLDCAQLNLTDLRGACFNHAHLKNARFGQAVVDGLTTLWECEVDHNTDFRGVGLDNIRIDPGTKQLLEYNIRRKNWGKWYKEHPKSKWLVKPF